MESYEETEIKYHCYVPAPPSPFFCSSHYKTLSMKRLLIVFLSLMFVVCCLPMDRDTVWGIHNRSDHDIYFVLDFQPEDTVITVGSACELVKSHTIGTLSSKSLRPLKDSLHMYILDGRAVQLRGWCKLTEEQISLIYRSAILDRVTRTQQSKTFGYAYPPETD